MAGLKVVSLTGGLKPRAIFTRPLQGRKKSGVEPPHSIKGKGGPSGVAARMVIVAWRSKDEGSEFNLQVVESKPRKLKHEL